MRTIKLYDAWIQAIMIIVFFILGVINTSNSILVGYFVVGSYQVINAITHTLFDFKSTSKYRHYYNLTLVYLSIVVAIAFLVPSILFIIAYLMLFISPFLAIAYNAICFYEVKKMYERPLAQLK